MNVLKHRLTLEMTALDSQVTVRIKKGDTKNKLIISLSENGKPYEITENLHADFVGKKPDRKIVYNKCNIVGNTIEYTITAQTSVAVGVVACEIRLYDINDNLLTSPRFSVIVDETIYDSDEIETESKNEIDMLDALISEVSDMKERFEQAIKWKAVEPNDPYRYPLKSGTLYRLYGDYESVDLEPYLRIGIAVDFGGSGIIQHRLVDEPQNLGLVENNGCATVRIIGYELEDNSNVNVVYLVNDESHTALLSFDNPEGERLIISDVYAYLLCEDAGDLTVYEAARGIYLVDAVTGKPYEIYIANGKIILEGSEG